MNNKKVGKKIFKPIYSEINYSFQIDLTFFPRYKKQNNGYDVLFTAININSRFAYAYYCQDKSTDNILNLLKKMESKTIIHSISCDYGKEFDNEKFKNYCQENEIKLFFIKNDGHKLGIINRFHRTLKEKLTKYFVNNDTVKWVDAIDDIIYNYNHSVNRGIGIEPYKVNNFIEQKIIENAKNKTEKINENEIKINVGDFCREIVEKTIYSDKMIPKYSNEIYQIIEVNKNNVVVDNNGKNKIIKNDNLKIVNNIENPLLQSQKLANILHKNKLRLLRENL